MLTEESRLANVLDCLHSYAAGAKTTRHTLRRTFYRRLLHMSLPPVKPLPKPTQRMQLDGQTLVAI